MVVVGTEVIKKLPFNGFPATPLNKTGVPGNRPCGLGVVIVIVEFIWRKLFLSLKLTTSLNHF